MTNHSLDRCNAAVFCKVGELLELRQFDVPEPGAGEAIVRVDLCTICGSDLHTVTGARIEPTPSILGHEIVGTVRQVGDPAPVDIDGQVLRVGDRITWSACISCFDCDRCQAGLPQKCRALAKYGHDIAAGHFALSGGLAEQILLRSGSTAIKLSPDVQDAIICPVNCATSTIAAAYRVAGSIAEQRVLILGAGMLGLTAAAFANSNAAAGVTICDPNDSRLQVAERFGADRCVTGPRELDDTLFDIIIECSGSPAAVELACSLGDVGARVVLVGTVMETRLVSVDPQQMVRRWLSIHGVHNYAPQDLQTAVRFLTQFADRFPFAELVEKTFSLSEVNDAISYAVQHRPVRVGVRP